MNSQRPAGQNEGRHRVKVTLREVSGIHPHSRYADRVRRFELDAGRTSIILGRASKNRGLLAGPSNLWIESPIITKEHARFIRGENPCEPLLLKDLNSTHGTWVHGRRLDTEYALQDGDMLTFGDQVTNGVEKYLPHQFMVDSVEVQYTKCDPPAPLQVLADIVCSDPITPVPSPKAGEAHAGCFKYPEPSEASDDDLADSEDWDSDYHDDSPSPRSSADSAHSRRSSVSRDAFSVKVPFSDEETTDDEEDSDLDNQDADHESLDLDVTHEDVGRDDLDSVISLPPTQPSDKSDSEHESPSQGGDEAELLVAQAVNTTDPTEKDDLQVISENVFNSSLHDRTPQALGQCIEIQDDMTDSIASMEPASFPSYATPGHSARQPILLDDFDAAEGNAPRAEEQVIPAPTHYKFACNLVGPAPVNASEALESGHSSATGDPVLSKHNHACIFTGPHPIQWAGEKMSTCCIDPPPGLASANAANCMFPAQSQPAPEEPTLKFPPLDVCTQKGSGRQPSPSDAALAKPRPLNSDWNLGMIGMAQGPVYSAPQPPKAADTPAGSTWRFGPFSYSSYSPTDPQMPVDMVSSLVNDYGKQPLNTYMEGPFARPQMGAESNDRVPSSPEVNRSNGLAIDELIHKPPPSQGLVNEAPKRGLKRTFIGTVLHNGEARETVGQVPLNPPSCMGEAVAGSHPSFLNAEFDSTVEPEVDQPFLNDEVGDHAETDFFEEDYVDEDDGFDGNLEMDDQAAAEYPGELSPIPRADNTYAFSIMRGVEGESADQIDPQHTEGTEDAPASIRQSTSTDEVPVDSPLDVLQELCGESRDTPQELDASQQPEARPENQAKAIEELRASIQEAVAKAEEEVEPPRKKAKIERAVSRRTPRRRLGRFMGKMVPFMAGAAATAATIFGAAGFLISTMPGELRDEALREMF